MGRRKRSRKGKGEYAIGLREMDASVFAVKWSTSPLSIRSRQQFY